MLIDVSDIKTIPIEVEKKIWEKFTAMPRSINLRLRHMRLSIIGM